MNFKAVSGLISEVPLSLMSDISYHILNTVDLKHIKRMCRRNFIRLHDAIASLNKYKIPDLESFEWPMVFKFRSDNLKLKEKLIRNKIFVAINWSNIKI